MEDKEDLAFKIEDLVVALEDMSWLYSGVERSLIGLSHLKEIESIKSSIESLRKDHDSLYELIRNRDTVE